MSRLSNGGDRTERRLFIAVNENHAKPYWLLGLDRATPVLDLFGVDSLAIVRYPGGDTVRVPIQVKSLGSQIADYYCKHPDALKARVIVIVITRHMGYVDIRRRLYEEIERRRQGDVRFDNYLHGLETRPISNVEQKYINEIAAHRNGARRRHGVRRLQAAE